ncbi:MAG TPA: SHOCT domain-containing protein [Candidatus Tectomicrobia bacterium]
MMHELTPEGQQHVRELAQRYGVSVDAVMTLLRALLQGHGTMAQFEHRELGGRGQWMPGGMVMVGDMWNHALKTTVDGLCAALTRLLPPDLWQAQPVRSHRPGQDGQQQGDMSQPASSRVSTAPRMFEPGSAVGETAWWPTDLGAPATRGAQQTMRYAYFPEKRRLAVSIHGQVTVYDTLDHHVSGVSQQQGAASSLTFTSQHGVVALHTLPVLASNRPAATSPALIRPAAAPPDASAQPEAGMLRSARHPAPVPPLADAESVPATDIFAALERLAELHHKGILSEEEFTTTKAALLRRI